MPAHATRMLPAAPALLLCGVMSACATTRCPTGTTAAGKPPPTGTAQWCEAKPSDGKPPARETESKTALAEMPGLPPHSAGRSLQGPMTTWTQSGQPESHGSYLPGSDGESVPSGLWTFWYPNGQVRSRGSYVMGAPFGCFSLWDEQGRRRTAQWSAEDKAFVDAPCEGPSAQPLEDLEDELHDARLDTVRGDLMVGTLFSRGGFGIKNQSYVVAEPNLSRNVEVSARRRLRHLRLGGLLAWRRSDDGGHEGWVAAATLAMPLPSPDERLALEVSLALGAQYTDAQLTLRADPTMHSVGPLSFFGPYAATEFTAAIRASKKIELVIAGRAEGTVPRDWTISKILDSPTERPIRHTETWEIGRYSLGLGLGMRVSFY